MNAFAERFVQSIRRECLSKVIPLGEGHLRRTISAYVEHYHEERNHQGLGNRLIEPSVAANGAGRSAGGHGLAVYSRFITGRWPKRVI